MSQDGYLVLITLNYVYIWKHFFHTNMLWKIVSVLSQLTEQRVFTFYREHKKRSWYGWLAFTFEVISGIWGFLFYSCINCYRQCLLYMNLLYTYCPVWNLLLLDNNGEKILRVLLNNSCLLRILHPTSHTFIKIRILCRSILSNDWVFSMEIHPFFLVMWTRHVVGPEILCLNCLTV